MKSVDELVEMHKALYQSCYNYATGRLNGEPVRSALQKIITDELSARLSIDEYSFEVRCNADNNPMEVRARSGYHVDLRIIEKQGQKRTFNMPIHYPPFKSPA